MEKCCECGGVFNRVESNIQNHEPCATEHCTQSTDTQQLKAEISAMISKWKHCCELGDDWYEVEPCDYERLQKLSAV